MPDSPAYILSLKTKYKIKPFSSRMDANAQLRKIRSKLGERDYC